MSDTADQFNDEATLRALHDEHARSIGAQPSTRAIPANRLTNVDRDAARAARQQIPVNGVARNMTIADD